MSPWPGPHLMRGFVGRPALILDLATVMPIASTQAAKRLGVDPSISMACSETI